MKISATSTNDTMLASAVSRCDWAISSNSSTGSPVTPTLTPGTSALVRATNSRSLCTAWSFRSSLRDRAVTM